MLLTVGDKKYALHFTHDRDYLESAGLQITYCELHEGKCKVKGCAGLFHPYRGLALCHPNDQFSKSAGRKIALGRALQNLPREIRKQIWEAYFKVSPHR